MYNKCNDDDFFGQYSNKKTGAYTLKNAVLKTAQVGLKMDKLSDSVVETQRLG